MWPIQPSLFCRSERPLVAGLSFIDPCSADLRGHWLLVCGSERPPVAGLLDLRGHGLLVCCLSQILVLWICEATGCWSVDLRGHWLLVCCPSQILVLWICEATGCGCAVLHRSLFCGSVRPLVAGVLSFTDPCSVDL